MVLKKNFKLLKTRKYLLNKNNKKSLFSYFKKYVTQNKNVVKVFLVRQILSSKLFLF